MSDSRLKSALSRLRPGRNPKPILELPAASEGMHAAYRNASALAGDARALYRHGSIARAVALTVLATEELSKVVEIHDAFTLTALTADEKIWPKFWRAFYRHGPKQASADRYGREMKRQALESGLTFTLQVMHEQGDLDGIDNVKQACLYVDYDGRRWLVPDDGGEDLVTALDELLAATEERINAFAERHCTLSRSRQTLEHRLELIEKVKTTPTTMVELLKANRFEPTESVVEVAADIRTAIQACVRVDVPDYAMLKTWLEESQQEAESFREAFPVVQRDIESRVRDGEGLKRCYRRAFFELKLLVFLAGEVGVPLNFGSTTPDA